MKNCAYHFKNNAFKYENFTNLAIFHIFKIVYFTYVILHKISYRFTYNNFRNF